MPTEETPERLVRLSDGLYDSPTPKHHPGERDNRPATTSARRACAEHDGEVDPDEARHHAGSASASYEHEAEPAA